jgi:ribosomal protein L14
MQTQTIIHIIDNSGVKKTSCIRVIGSIKSLPGSKSVVSVKTMIVKEKKRIGIGSVSQALLTCSRQKRNRCDGASFRASKNSAVLIKNEAPIGNRVNRHICYDLNLNRLPKLAMISDVPI